MRQYISFDPKQGYPASPTTSYECTRCGATVPSIPGPQDPYECTCRNIRIDVDAGRVSVDDHGHMKAFRNA